MNYYCKGDGTYHYKSELPNSLRPFVDYQFSSGGYIGEDFKSFSRKFRNAIKKLLPQNWTIHKYMVNHYDVTTILSDSHNRLVYVSIPDVRYWHNEWFTNILIRTMKHEKDWLGGTNHYTTLFTFTKDVENLCR